MIPPTVSEVDEALDGFAAANKEELDAFTEMAFDSTGFRCEAVAAARMLAEEGRRGPDALWALMIVMLRAGMAIERKRHEVGLLESLYK
jgi:hypothetical protein